MSLLETIAVVLIFLAGLAFLVIRDWRWSLAALAVQYLGVFILVIGWLGLELAAIKLIAGWMATAILGATRPGTIAGDDRQAGALFKVFVYLLICLSMWAAVGGMLDWFPELLPFQGMSALILIGTGLFGMGIEKSPVRMVSGLLFFMSGFELVYAALEPSALVAGLLAAVALALALAGAYLSTGELPKLEEEESL